MDEGNENVEEAGSYAGQQEGTAQQEYTPPESRVPPKKSHKGLWIGIISGIVVVIIIAVIFLAPIFAQSPIVGIWHITKRTSASPYGNDTESVNEYLQFNNTGTGAWYVTGMHKKFTWRDVGQSTVAVTMQEGNGSDLKITVNMHYKISGDQITITYKIENTEYTHYGERVSSIPPSPLPEYINSWDIRINGEQTKVIVAQVQDNGYATWSGNVTITIYDENGHPLPNVKVILDGCGVVEAGTTDMDGKVTIELRGVTLPSGVQEDEIQVEMQYPGPNGEQTKTDVITVIRSS